ncbi:MAG: hypothetical protein DRP47_12100 [Candidatus Zixiibacteriota bacterium]|nr:MAG: hypothetical protein DRP47_12100 [candidate division Zixibacteria bacterium]
MNVEPINTNEIIAQIRTEVQQPQPGKFVNFRTKKSYTLKELLLYHGAEFIYVAYVAALHRAPDPDGMENYLAALREGRITKIDILGNLRFSPEGRRGKGQIKGLLIPFLIHRSYKLPIIGRLMRLSVAALSLPKFYLQLQSLEMEVHQAETRLQHLEYIRTTFMQQISTLNEHVAQQDDNLREMSAQLTISRLSFVDIQRRMKDFLEEARSRLPEAVSTQQIEKILTEEDHFLDAMYVSFEERFRGSREDVKQRLQVYLPYVKVALHATDVSPMLDVGCGRGEWLELLEEQKAVIKGVDLNRIMIAQCQALNFDVLEADVIDYLSDVKNNSLSVVSGFHIIEHLPFETLIALLDESFRVLKPGGIIIFETPNPENLIVGAHLFYTDPTHRNPIVPATMQFLAQQRGFTRVEVIRLHKYSDHYPAVTTDKQLKLQLDNEMDFSVIGYKE